MEGAIHLRRGGRVLTATRDEISALILARADASRRWERQFVVGAERTALDDDLIADTVRMARAAERWPGEPTDSDGFLRSLGLTAQGGLTHAAVLLFGRQPTRWLPQARVRLLVMPEGKTGNRYAIDRIFDACLLRETQQIADALAPHALGTESRFSAGGWRREDRVRYPSTALREGVMNALVHRDYEHSGSITISVPPGRIVVSNPGGLPAGLTPADLKRDHLSILRNPDVAHVCYLRGLIEKIGRGTQRIVEDCRRAGLRSPVWRSTGLETTLSFFASAARTERTAATLSSRQQRILEAFDEKQQRRAGEILALFGRDVTERTVRYDLQFLVEGGWLVRGGGGRGTWYARGSRDERG